MRINKLKLRDQVIAFDNSNNQIFFNVIEDEN
jgi:hypothetical protein